VGDAFYAGLRRGELRALRVHEFDFAAGKLHVRRTWDDVDGEQDGGKSDAARRDLPIMALRGELHDHLMRTGRRGVDLVFGEDGVPFCPSTVRRRAQGPSAGAIGHERRPA
jgi:integrase